MKTPNGDLDSWPDPASSNARRSVFAQDLVVEGDATSSGPIEVRGNVIGSLRAPEITVAGSGRGEGSIVAPVLVVLGAVSGTASARSVQRAPSAVVQADVTHERIAIEVGAELDGRLQRKASQISQRKVWRQHLAGRQIAPPHLLSKGLRCCPLRFFHGGASLESCPSMRSDPAPGPQDGDVSTASPQHRC